MKNEQIQVSGNPGHQAPEYVQGVFERAQFHLQFVQFPCVQVLGSSGPEAALVPNL